MAFRLWLENFDHIIQVRLLSDVNLAFILYHLNSLIKLKSHFGLVFQQGIKLVNLILLAEILLFVFFNFFSGQFEQLGQYIFIFLDL